MPRAINQLEEPAGALQGNIDRIRTSINEERSRLRLADQNVAVIPPALSRLCFPLVPGVVNKDEVMIDPRNWRPMILHRVELLGRWQWREKTLFNVICALALHEAARARGMPRPMF